MIEEIVSDVKRWAAKPYDDNHSVFDWFLFLGFVTCVTFFWTLIIKRLTD